MDIRNILYKSIEQKIENGTKEYKLFEVDALSAYTIRVYIDSSGNKFSFEVNNDSNGANYKIENYAINQNITIYKNNQSNSDIYYVKFTNNTNFTIRKEIVYGYLTDANTTNVAVAGNPIITLTTSSPKHIFAGNSAFIGNSTVTGDVDFDGGFTAEKDINLTGNINFHNFYIDDFINTPGTVPDSASKITFKDSDETLDIYGIYNEILQPIKVDNSVYQGKITILVSISNATLSESTQGAAELILLELVGTSQPEQKYQVVYIQSSSSIEIRSIKSNNKEVLSTIMIGGNYIINTVTIPFANNISCKVTNVYLKEEGSAITIYKVADKIIGGGESDSDASHYLLTAQSLSQILTLSSLSAGATTTNLTKNPDSTFDYDDGKNYLIYQTGSNTTNLYLTNDDSNERYIYSQNRQVKNRIGTTASTANTIVIRDNNNNINTGSLTASNNINTGSLTASSVNAEGLNNAGTITVNGNASTGTLSITGKLTSGATTVTGASELQSLIANGDVTVTGAATLGDNASDQINFNAATTVKGTANFKSTLDANGGAVVTGKATLSSLTANGGVDVNGTTNLGDNASDQIRFNATTTVKGTAFVNGRINFGQVNESDAASIYATNDSTTSGIIFSIADDADDYFAFRSSHWENGAKDILKLTYTNITAGSNFIPLSNNAYNIGSTSNKWKNLYVDSIAGKFNTSLTIKGNGTNVATYNGSANDEVNIVAGTNISVSGNTTNGTITVAHPNHTAASQTAGFTNTYKLSIPNVKSDAQGHITENTRTEVDLSLHYLRCDANASINGSLTSNNAFILSGHGNGCGIFAGNGDQATLETYNWKLSSWYGIGIYDYCFSKTTGVIDTRTGSITMTGTITANKLVGTSLNVSGSSILGTSQSDVITLNGKLHFTGTTTNDYIRLYTEDIGNIGHKLVHHVHDSNSNAYYKFNFQNRAADTSYDIIFPNDNGTIALTKNMDISATRDGAANDISVDQFGTITITINGKSVTISQNSADGSLDISANV